MNITELLAFSVRNKASDLHLSAGLPPLLRVDGDIVRTTLPVLSHKDVHSMLYDIMTEAQRPYFDNHLECDFSFTAADGARFRVNAFNQVRGAAAVIRSIAASAPTLEQLEAPELFGLLALKKSGLILVTGPTGSGKSTTLAAMIDHINRHIAAHVLTIEDPIEFIHQPQLALINQREIGQHTGSFAAALRAALREDPDVIMVGELRDLESIRLALSAAETGHLVLGTLHTASAVKTVDRIVDVFPGDEKEMMRTMLSESLQAVISQTLLRRNPDNVGSIGNSGDGHGDNGTRSGRIAAHEILLATPAIRNLIRESNAGQMYSAMQTGGASGMHTLDQHLAQLVRRQLITPETALHAARYPDSLPG